MGSKARTLAISAVAAIAACLPDLGDLPPDTTITVQKPCGDGLIGPDEECDPGDGGTGPGCSDCHIACEGKVDVAGHCYFRVDPIGPNTLLGATSACVNAQARIVTLASEDQRRVVDEIADTSPYWLAISIAGGVPAYTTLLAEIPLGTNAGWPQPPCTGPCDGCYGFGADGGGFDYLDGGATPPPPSSSCIADPVKTCVVAFPKEQKWRAVSCLSPEILPITICERAPSGHVKPGFCGGPACFSVPSTHTKKIYGYIDGKTAEADADRTCKEQFGGGSLVHIADEEERSELFRTIIDLYGVEPEYHVWIGLHYDQASSSFVWDDGTPGLTRIWGDQQPAPTSHGRAYLRIARVYDSGLASASDGTGVGAVLCERPAQ